MSIGLSARAEDKVNWFLVNRLLPWRVKVMSNENNHRLRDTLPLPPEITRHYEGKYIIYSEDEGRVIGVGDTPEDAWTQARASGVGGEWHYAYADRPDEGIF